MSDSETIGRYATQIRKSLKQGDKQGAKALVKQAADDVGQENFERLDDILKEYDDTTRGGKMLWGQWGPADDLVAEGCASVENTFTENAGMLMGGKGFEAGRSGAADMIGVKGGMWSADMEGNPCDLCAELDGQEFDIETLNAISPPVHCQCQCVVLYVDEEETNWQPDGPNIDEIQGMMGEGELGDLISKHGHEMPMWQEHERAANECSVSSRAIVGIMDDIAEGVEEDIAS